MFVVTQLGQMRLLSCAINKQSPDNLVLRLFVNDKVPLVTDVLSDYVEMSLVTGYVPKTLTGSSWSVGLNNSDIVVSSYAMQTFAFTSTVTSYGYYLTDNAGLVVILAERFKNTAILPFNGGNIKVTPSLAFGGC